MEQKTVTTANAKLKVRRWPKRSAESRAVQMVAIVLEYFLSIVSANLRHPRHLSDLEGFLPVDCGKMRSSFPARRC